MPRALAMKRHLGDEVRTCARQINSEQGTGNKVHRIAVAAGVFLCIAAIATYSMWPIEAEDAIVEQEESASAP
ncbi:MAG: hypothetical protein DI533_05105 [Cereibacter sphaeroides]|uniref:Uncharacterized protein n=1 Tax=Cereibacter sphaeroides TaxID=1063 RepID=A0A2W5SAG5_CERSP|nr:MAG: hypothetical protein DI533_05105 [Cereibacter sphaeroides]